MVLASAGCTFGLFVPFLADTAFNFDAIRQASSSVGPIACCELKARIWCQAVSVGTLDCPFSPCTSSSTPQTLQTPVNLFCPDRVLDGTPEAAQP